MPTLLLRRPRLSRSELTGPVLAPAVASAAGDPLAVTTTRAAAAASMTTSKLGLTIYGSSSRQQGSCTCRKNRKKSAPCCSGHGWSVVGAVTALLEAAAGDISCVSRTARQCRAAQPLQARIFSPPELQCAAKRVSVTDRFLCWRGRVTVQEVIIFRVISGTRIREK